MKKLILIPLMLAVTGCTAIGPALELAGTVVGKINANVQQAATQLHDNCLLLQSGLAIGQSQLPPSSKLQNAIAIGEKTLGSYCTGAPPTDIPTALQTVARIYNDVITAKAAAANATPVLSSPTPVPLGH
jgi:hypothetical protein